MRTVQIGDLVRERREAVGMSIRALARRADVTVEAVQRIESGVTRRPGRQVLSRIATVVDGDLSLWLQAVGWERQVPTNDVAAAIETFREVVNGDPLLNVVQADALIAHYASYLND